MGLYFDYNATNIPDPRLLEKFIEVLRTNHGNPSSPHKLGRQARAVVELAREQLASAYGFDLSGVTFCGTGSEALNLAIFGLRDWQRGDVVLCSKAEHKAVIESMKALEKRGVELRWISVNPDGTLDFAQLAAQCNSDVKLVIAMAANNETGVLTSPARIREQIGSTPLLVDAVQSAARVELDYSAADMLTLSAHKMGCPKGAAAVLTRPGLDLQPVTFGGSQERGRRPGTEATAAIAALGEAARLWQSKELWDLCSLTVRQSKFEESLMQALPRAVITSKSVSRLPQTTHLRVPGYDAESTIAGLDLMGFQVSSGSACSSGSLLPSHVLLAMGMSENEALESLRLSYGPQTQSQDLDRLIEALTTLCQ